MAKVVDRLDKDFGLSPEPSERASELQTLEEISEAEADEIVFGFELAFQLKASLAALVKGRLIYIGPNVSTSRIIAITLCAILLLATFFGGVFALLHLGGPAHP